MPWTAGQRLQGGKYVIGEVLGQGGFGITYKALHVELNQTVVIKTPNEHLRHDPEYDKYIDRFIKEGQILARLSEEPHPHIVRVIDLFKEGAIHCLVMDFVPGENLFEAVRRRGALPEAEIVPCIRQIGEALMMVHQAGLVHRDAHPGNIMLRNNGKAVLIDFGIAKELLPKTLSSTGNAGNHGFAPYEQITRGSREPTVDIYCLAATLYYAVTGQNPTTSLARKLDDASLTPPKQIIPDISEQLNYAILKGMALEAEDRPQSMQEWLTMLEALKASPPPLVEPVHKIEVVRRQFDESKSKPATKSPRIIAWGWLVGVLLNYTNISYFLAALNAPRIIWAVAVAWVVAWAGLAAVAVAWAGLVAVAVAVAGVVAVAVAGALSGVVAVAWAGALATVWAGKKLQKSFSKVHTFLILASTSSLGLGLGLLGHRIFHTGS
ncbi:serine/threonine protein kinase [Brasilonema bromeliae]|uniref:Serine/threonine protein kinase n=1 Tax=Brasilonema bromeliae SPC951 TaxID=385972 RepID=A0ABX1P739_9CYAN|nr:serine/threonine-protein kinase [Brasilonema bromeliae]NMG20205.1 serine/threonine protein kinase [Brasilonema bromeliae SPC951]